MGQRLSDQLSWGRFVVQAASSTVGEKIAVSSAWLISGQNRSAQMGNGTTCFRQGRRFKFKLQLRLCTGQTVGDKASGSEDEAQTCLADRRAAAYLRRDPELRQPMMFLAKVKVNQLAADAINAAIKAEFARAAESDKMILWRTTDEGKITGFELDYKQQMAITAKTIEVVERTLKQHEDVPERIPIGHALNSPLISSIGPSVAVNFHPASVVKAEVGLQQTEAGINMLLVEVYVRIRTEVAVVIPFDREPEIVETKIPLSYALVVGEVPSYYYDGSGNPVGSGASQAPAIALPPPDATVAPSTHTP